MSKKQSDAVFRRALKVRAREFRHEPTPAEAALWERVRNHQVAGLKFRRQQRLLRFVADFFCAEFKLVIELDGPIHEDQADRDADRQKLLESGEIAFLRFTNTDVL